MSIVSAPLLVLTNVPSKELAQTLARQLLEQRLAACVNILPAVHSVYRWQDKIEVADEVMLQIKTSQARYAELEVAIRALHPYALPEIIAMPIVAGLSPYLEWIERETEKGTDV